MQTENFQFQYLLVIKTYFANFSNKILKKEEEYNTATQQLYFWRLFVVLMELYCKILLLADEQNKGKVLFYECNAFSMLNITL